MRVTEHTNPVARAEFCREFLRRQSIMVKREIARRRARELLDRLAHLALLSERVRP